MTIFGSKLKTGIAAAVAVVLIVSLSVWVALRPVSGDRSPVRVVIKRGSNAGEIAEVLSEKGLIRSALLFKLSCKWNGRGAALKPGVYELNRAMTMSDMISVIAGGKSLECWVTVPEGFTARQIGDVLEAKKLEKSSDFTNLTVNGGFDTSKYSFLDGSNLEGYLFPDTYLVPRDADADAVVKTMLDTFQKRVVMPYRGEIEQCIWFRFGMSKGQFAEGLQKILTVASLVEREARKSNDRALIAAVIWNRLAKGMRLEIDATVSYVPGESTNNKSRVYYRDLAADSPYNTYRNAGLPPAPICNPGIESIKAALSPANASYLFYVARKDGSHVFSNTFDQHLAAKRAVKSGS